MKDISMKTFPDQALSLKKEAAMEKKLIADATPVKTRPSLPVG